MFNDWVVSMQHERYLSLSLITDSTPISNLVMLTFASALSDQIETSSIHSIFYQSPESTWICTIFLP